jgi:hypothetical protein
VELDIVQTVDAIRASLVDAKASLIIKAKVRAARLECPVCGRMMSNNKPDVVRCSYSNCKLFGIKFNITKVVLTINEEADRTRT